MVFRHLENLSMLARMIQKIASTASISPELVLLPHGSCREYIRMLTCCYLTHMICIGLYLTTPRHGRSHEILILHDIHFAPTVRPVQGFQTISRLWDSTILMIGHELPLVDRLQTSKGKRAANTVALCGPCSKNTRTSNDHRILSMTLSSGNCRRMSAPPS